MKILILLSLAGFCLASKYQRKKFSFPGQPNSDKASNTLIWSDYVSEGLPKPDDSNNAEVDVAPDVVLSNPHRRDVKLGNGFPVFGFHSAPKKTKSHDNIREQSPHSLNTTPVEPLFVENNETSLQKDESSPSEESKGEVDDQEASPSSSQNNTEAAAENTVAPAPEEENHHAEVFQKNDPSVKSGFLPFVANPFHPNSAVRKWQINNQRPRPAKLSNFSRSRGLRSADYNPLESGFKLSDNRGQKLQEPTVQIGGARKTINRVRRPSN